MELAVEKRDTKAKIGTLRKQGVLPAVIYGRSHEATAISVDEKAFEKIFRAAGESTVITLTGLGAPSDALIHEVAVHPVSGLALHADFYAIQKGQTVTVSIPFEFEGVSEAVKSKGCILVKVMHELELECEPKNLPQHIIVDISALESADDKITVGDLKLPANVKISADKDEIVAMVTEAKEETETAAMDITQIETSVERGKKEEEVEIAE
jgi:large subunit ribosomal protein L25